MDHENNENNFELSDTITISQSSITETPSNHCRTNYSSTTIGTNDARRSVRLSTKTSKKPLSSLNQTNIHRTITGGVGNNHSPKLSNRKRASASTETGDSTSKATTDSTITTNDNNGIYTTNNNNNTSGQNLLPSDQSTDDEMIIDNNATTVKGKPNGLLTRTQIYQASIRSDANLRKHLASTPHQVESVLFTSQINNNSKSEIPNVIPERKRELHKAAIDAIVRDGLSFGVFRQPGMAQFLQTAVPGYVGPHRHTVRKKIARLYSSYTNKLRSVLSNVDFLALTCDLWRSARRVYYISLTGHIFNKSYETIPIVLGCRRIIGRHLSTTIEKYIKFEINRLKIKPEQIVSITTDNGSEMKAATSNSQFGNRISCMAHNLNLVVKHGLCLWKKPNPKHFPLNINLNSSEWQDINDEDDNEDTSEIDVNDIETTTELLSDEDNDGNNSISSDDTNADKVVSDEFTSDDDIAIDVSALTIDEKRTSIDHYQLLTFIFQLLQKVRVGIKFIKNHNVINEFMIKNIKLKNNGKNKGGLVMDMLIRWNSTYLLLKRLLENKDLVKNVFSCPNDFDSLTDIQKKTLNECLIKQNEWDLLQNLRDLLEPFETATTEMSGQYYPTMASSYLICRFLSDFVRASKNDKEEIITLKESLQFWFNYYFNKQVSSGQVELMKISAFLDPIAYKMLDDDERKSAKKLIFQKLKNSSTSFISSFPTAQTTTTTGVSNALQKLALLCGRTTSFPSSTTLKQTITLDEELSSYIDATRTATSFQQFWTSHQDLFPRLSRLVRRINIIPATSVSSESLFSIGNYLSRKQRSSLSSNTLRYLLVLKNSHFLDKLVTDL